MVRVESLDQEGRGVAHDQGKVIFIEGALPGERVTYSSYRKKASFEIAQLAQVLVPSPSRVQPRCPHFGVCGGCTLQHLEPGAQVAAKQRVLEEQLQRIGKVAPEQMLSPVHGPPWGYRQRARFSVRRVRKKGGVLVGFHEKRSGFIADMAQCPVIPAHISELLMPLRELIGALSIGDRVAQVELAVAEGADALVLRHLEPFAPQDEALLRGFAARHGVRFFRQPAGPGSVVPYIPDASEPLQYTLPEFDLTLRFGPADFTQVNPAVNRVLVRRAVNLLDPRPGERALDLFCGLGNFTLALARRGARVLGLEGSPALVKRARENALANGLAQRAEFGVVDLFRVTPSTWESWGPIDKLLLDPPRDGAVAAVASLGAEGPRRIVYVSCNPSTLARDAGTLVHDKGYRLAAAGVVNMFPHTAHVESVALFDRGW